MSQAAVSFRVDEELKNDMAITCKKMGITPTIAHTLFMKKVVHDRKLPFEVECLDEKPLCMEDLTLKQLDAEIEKAEENVRKGNTLSHEEFKASINKELSKCMQA